MVYPEKYRNEYVDRGNKNTDTNDEDTDEILDFNKDKAMRTYGKDKNEKIDSKKNDEVDIHEIIKFNKGKTNKVHDTNEEKKKLLRQRREKAIQNTKDKETEKANTQAALQACTRANKASKTNQVIEMTNNATEYEDDTDEISLFSRPPGKPDHSVQTKTSSRCKTVCTEPLLGDPLPGSQATMEMQGHKPELGNIGIYEFLIEGELNPPDLEGIEEEQLMQMQ